MVTTQFVSYHALKVLAGLFVEAVGFQSADILSFLLLCFDCFLLGAHLRINLDVEFEEVVDGVLLECLLVSVPLIGQGEQSILLAPVSKICI